MMEGFSRGNPPAHWHSIDTLNHGPAMPQSPATTSVTIGTNVSIYVPLRVFSSVVVKKLWFANDATATGNYDIGLYDASGAPLLRKGSTAKTTTAAEIVWDCTDTTVSPGLYYIAMASDTGTDTFIGLNYTAPHLAAVGVLTESAFPLPASASWAVAQAAAQLPVMGLFLDTKVS